jgi:enoyl-CoA hydratase
MLCRFSGKNIRILSSRLACLTTASSRLPLAQGKLTLTLSRTLHFSTTSTSASSASASASAASSAAAASAAAASAAASSTRRDGPAVVTQFDDTGVAILTLNRPDTQNAMTVSMGDEFETAVRMLKKDSSVRCIVINGAGRAFSAGGDLKFLQSRPELDPSENSATMKRFYERFLSIRDVPVPVIAAIDGAAVGAGLCLAMACDIRITRPDAKLGATFVDLGLHPGMGASHFMPKLIGTEAAAKLLLTGELILGTEAKELGLVCELSQDPVERALELANRIASQSSVAVQTTIRSLRLSQEDSLQRALWREASSQALCYAGPEYAKRLDAVVQRVTKGKKNA